MYFKLSLQINLALTIYLHQVRVNKIQYIPVTQKVVEIVLQGLRIEDYHHYWWGEGGEVATLLDHFSKE